ncbi:MAG TPA: prolyl-tRNA synthetase associated domain-containing protein [Alphaproteobacteria bacterium]|nr:prolyl-tRNA synthetase associated domain-containing protein [Alphaproteobacteria bacterium]
MDKTAFTPPGPPPTKPDQLLAKLEALGIPYVNHRHRPLYTVAESQDLRGEIPGGHCKSLFLEDKRGRLWLLVAQEDTPIRLNRLHARLGAGRLSFASFDRLWVVLGVVPGSVTPFAVVNDAAGLVTVVLERAMLAHDRLNYHPLSNDQTTTIASADLIRFLRACGHEPVVADLTLDEAG